MIVGLTIGLLVFRAGQIQNISGETTQAVSCILNSEFFGEKFNQSCFLGYPSRAYFIQALPSLIFGRSLFSLNLGAVIIFVPGLIMFTYGLVLKSKNTKLSDLIVGLGLSALLHFYSVNHFLFFSFEQSIFPLSFGLMGFGLLLIYQQQRQLLPLLLFIFVVFLSVFSYTPSLSLLPIFFYYLVSIKYDILWKRLVVPIIFATVAVSSIFVSIDYREDIRINSETSGLEGQLMSISDNISMIGKTLSEPYHTQFVSTWVGVMLIVPVILSGMSNFKHVLPLLWVLGTFYLATFAKGYADYSVSFRVHRGLVILPVVLIEFTQFVNYIFSKFILKRSKSLNLIVRSLLLLMIFVIFVTGLKKNHEYINTKSADDRQLLNVYMSNNFVYSNADKSELLIVESPPQQNLISAQDGLQYFAPSISLTRLISTEECFSEKIGLYLFSGDNDCLNYLEKTRQIKYLGSYLDTDNQNKTLYRREYSLSYSNSP